MPNIADNVSAYQEDVILQYHRYNDLFLTLPFAHLQEVGSKLPVFTKLCQAQLQQKKSPEEIVNYFFTRVVSIDDFEKQSQFLFLILQFVERQIVLFDALEDAAFTSVHDVMEQGTIPRFLDHVKFMEFNPHDRRAVMTYRTRIVLTAHPTQFYPSQILGIIHDLFLAIKARHPEQIRNILLQLGKTGFKNKKKPTPMDEANILIHRLEYVFYPVIKTIHAEITAAFNTQEEASTLLPALIELGFWPGGDRDGNAAVDAEVTLAVAKKLRFKILRRYIKEVKILRRYLTFGTLWEQLHRIQTRLIATQAIDSNTQNKHRGYQDADAFISDLRKIHNDLIKNHQGLFVDKVNAVLSAVLSFGFYFASMDLRQDSRVHTRAIARLLKHFIKTRKIPASIKESCQCYVSLSGDEKLHVLEKLLLLKRPNIDSALKKQDKLTVDTIESLRAAQKIQQKNGERGLHRYIISHTNAAYQIFEVLLLAYWAGWPKDALTLDIVPLFESIDALNHADHIMQKVYAHPIYKKHLRFRKQTQTVMLGFSDGTKDGGYLTANWTIYTCKNRLAQQAKKAGIQIIFFDGRGGPPARGGENTHRFYRGMAVDLKQRIQLTIQGQTISSNYGTTDSAYYNIGQLYTAGIESQLTHEQIQPFSQEDRDVLQQLSDISQQHYFELKNHPLFIRYLEEITPLSYYADLNIASRPPRRSKGKTLTLSDLRAIPFVSAWSQIKQNVPGYYGMGSALQALIDQGKGDQLKMLYQQSLFFKTLLDNAMQSLKKSYFPLTAYLKKDNVFGKFWQKLEQEATLTVACLQRICVQKKLLASDPINAASIEMREHIVLPLLIIQQYALMQLRKATQQKIPLSPKQYRTYRKIILKSLAANINASRNSA